MPSIFDQLSDSDDTTIKDTTLTDNNLPDNLNVKDPQPEDKLGVQTNEQVQVPAPPQPATAVPTTSKSAGQDLQAPAAPTEAVVNSEPQKIKITYFLAMFAEDQLRKPEKQRKAINTFLFLTSDQEFDTLKAQILQKISEKLKPKTLAYGNYSVEWYIPRIQTAPLALSSPDDYKFLLNHALKRKAPTANIVIQILPAAKKLKHRRECDDESGDENQSESENSDSEDEKPKKKLKKDMKKSKTHVESLLNEKITSKIVQLQNRWSCSKAGCSNNHCFIHPDYPDHFPLWQEQLSVWASAWNKDKELTDIETPPNHSTLFLVGNLRLVLSSISTFPPDLFAPLCPASEVCAVQDVVNTAIVHTPAAATVALADQGALIPVGAQLGPDLSLNDFCTQYSLSDDI
ncbi:hypothetical protein EV702DRAFT_1199763 [Suillus placidus]|uniref:Uncharacterized protein n=1 Tax=Suillus placidus TaxID=48579 RepID=A0A9P6ZQJ3_9AGAM|nr:hypothetical protein EV702DRAFT_1199763 [Suillus placidus]